MVLVNDRKYACATCIKGHRVSACVHTDRPLFEIKKKGRPTTQCQCCKERRKTDSVHSKCTCGEQKPSPLLLSNPSASSFERAPSPPRQLSSDLQHPSETETRKGVPGSTPTFPNGLRDVHEMAAAADALADLGMDGGSRPERQLKNLLNPCQCNTGSICKCCLPKRSPRQPSTSPHGSSSGTPKSDATGHQVTDSLIEMFRDKATTSTSSRESGSSSSPTPSAESHSSATTLRPGWFNNVPYLSPSNMHHPAHTSPHVHKTKLYSPYSTGHNTPKHGKKDTGRPDVAPRPPPPKIRPLADMSTFLGAIFRDDGSIASEIPRSALGLPGIKTFDAMAQNGGVKSEPMEMDVDMPLAFPTAEDAVIGACTCGEGCECPGCATHGNEFSTDHTGCGDSCRSCFNCAEQLSFPSGITSVEQLIAIAAARVPANPPRKIGVNELDPTDTRVLPISAGISHETAKSLGIIQLKPLECCNGRCQCPPGKCTCQSECCGCCLRCACDEDGDQNMRGHEETEAPLAENKGNCCSTPNPVSSGTPTLPTGSHTPPTPIDQVQVTQVVNTAPLPDSNHDSTSPVKGSCCGPSDKQTTSQCGPSRPSPSTLDSRTPVQSSVNQQFSALSMAQAGPSQPSVTLRRAASVSKVHQPSNLSNASTTASARRVSATKEGGSLQRSASAGKSASKALALHTIPHHPHPRPILPKGSVGSTTTRLIQSNGSGSGTRVASPILPTPGSSNVPSRSSSPPPLLSQRASTTSEGQKAIDKTRASNVAIPSLHTMNGTSDSNSSIDYGELMNLGQITKEDQDMMAYILQLTASGSLDTVDFSSNLFAANQHQPQGEPLNNGPSKAIDLSEIFGANGQDSIAHQQPLQLPLEYLNQNGPIGVPASNQQPLDFFDQSTQLGAGSDPTRANQSSNSIPFFGGFPNPEAVQRPLQNSSLYPDFNPQWDTSVPSTQGMTTDSQMYIPDISNFNGIASAPNGSIGPGGHSTDNGSVQPNPADGQNPDLIDISKPLNPRDVDRILRALQLQQEKQRINDQPIAYPPEQEVTIPPRPRSDTSGIASGYTSSDPSSGLPDQGSDPLFNDFVFDPTILGGNMGEDHSGSAGDGLNFGDGFAGFSQNGLGFAENGQAPNVDFQNMDWESQMKSWAAEAGRFM